MVMRKMRYSLVLLLIIFLLSSCALFNGSGRDGQSGAKRYFTEPPATALASALEDMRLGDEAQAVEELLFIRKHYQGTTWSARASFVLGMRELKGGGRMALQYLQEAQTLGVIRPYVLLYLARAYESEKMPSKAEASYAALLAEYPGFSYRGEALYESAVVLDEMGNYAEAGAALREFIKRYPRGSKAGEALMRSTRLEMASGDYAGAMEDIKSLIINHPGKAPARQAALLLKENRRLRPITLTREESCTRARALFDSYFYSSAVGALNGLVSKSPGACGAKAEPLLVETLFRLKRYGEAELILNKRLTRLRKGHNTKGYKERSTLLLLATAYLRDGNGKTSDFLDTTETLSRRFPGSGELRRALFMKGAYYEGAGEWKKAIDIYGSILKESGGPGAESAWHRGWLEYRMERYLDAYNTLSSFKGKLKAADRRKFAYWRGRALEKAGQKARALSEYPGACEGRMPGYYCYMAQSRLGPSGQSPWSAESIWGERGEEAGPVTEEGPPAGELRVAMALLGTGLTKEAAYEANKVLGGMHHAPDRKLILSLMRAFYMAGDYYHAIKVYDSYFGLLTGHDDAIAPELLRVAFPMKVVEYISAKGLAGDADPLLVAAVMREESSYDPDTISRTGAVGLMQVMPSTAKFIAEASGMSPLSAGALRDPETNISLGAWYLAYLWRKTSGNPVLTIAGYNAGLSSVRQWQKRYPLDDDEFIESIPYRETRNYTKKVLKSYEAFKMLAAGRRPLLAFGIREKGLVAGEKDLTRWGSLN